MAPSDCGDSEVVRLREKVHSLEVELAVLKQSGFDSDKALIIADAALKHSQEVSNEWRKENIDQRDLFPNKDEVNGKFATEASERRALEQRIVVLERAGSAGQGAHSANIYAIGLVIVAINIIIAVMFHFWK